MDVVGRGVDRMGMVREVVARALVDQCASHPHMTMDGILSSPTLSHSCCPLPFTSASCYFS